MDLSTITPDVSGRILVLFNHNRIDQRLLKNSLILAKYLSATIDILYFIAPNKTIHSSSPLNALNELDDETHRIQKKLENICQLIYHEEGIDINFCLRTGNATDAISKYITLTQPNIIALAKRKSWSRKFTLPRFLEAFKGSIYVQGKHNLPKTIQSLSVAYMLEDNYEGKKELINKLIQSIPDQVNYFQLAIHNTAENSQGFAHTFQAEPFEFAQEREDALLHYIELLHSNVIYLCYGASQRYFDRYQTVLRSSSLPFFIEKQ